MGLFEKQNKKNTKDKFDSPVPGLSVGSEPMGHLLRITLRRLVILAKFMRSLPMVASARHPTKGLADALAPGDRV